MAQKDTKFSIAKRTEAVCTTTPITIVVSRNITPRISQTGKLSRDTTSSVTTGVHSVTPNLKM